MLACGEEKPQVLRATDEPAEVCRDGHGEGHLGLVHRVRWGDREGPTDRAVVRGDGQRDPWPPRLSFGAVKHVELGSVVEVVEGPRSDGRNAVELHVSGCALRRRDQPPPEAGVVQPRGTARVACDGAIPRAHGAPRPSRPSRRLLRENAPRTSTSTRGAASRRSMRGADGLVSSIDPRLHSARNPTRNSVVSSPSSPRA